MGSLVLRDLTIHYERQAVVQGFNLAIGEGEMAALLGPSGAGKTTILKVVAGLLPPTRGDILIDGKAVSAFPPEKRDIVMVFQKPLLFPFMNVAQNIAFGLKMRGDRPERQRAAVTRILKLTRLEGLGGRKVHALSGGQQQRVALARALVLEPAVLLMDEPLSNLDANLRQEMRELILSIQSELKITTLFVTHDQSEALMMAQRVALLLDGRLRQAGTPQDLFHRPADPEVARFFGGGNFFEGRLQGGIFECAFGDLPVAAASGNGHVRTATIRPEDIQLTLDAAGPPGSLTGSVVRTRFEGTATRAWIDCDTHELVVLTAAGELAPGQEVRLFLPPDKIRVFAEEKALE
ncbi:MAG: ABC transporter ATP-binding protein [Desulfobacterales bacterium]|nr:ABC transporter ATP-binding protein [Desulfobacterales bacterium]